MKTSILKIEKKFLFKFSGRLIFFLIHLMPYYIKLGFNIVDFPASESYYNKCISLPMYSTLSYEEKDFVIEQVNQFVNG